MSEPVLTLEGIEKSYRSGPDAVHVLRGVDLVQAPGQISALVAPSGAGKSTLLHVAGLLDVADRGRILLCGHEMSRQSDRRRTTARRGLIGFVYQFHHLLPEFTAAENVILPQLANGASRRQAARRAAELLSAVGLSERQNHRPAELSGGEQQRVAVARALANRPRLLLADEPTGNLDEATASQVFDMLLGLVRETGLSALIATHNMELARRMDRVLRLENGRLRPA